MALIDTITSHVTSINGYIESWDESIAISLNYKEMTLLDLKSQLLSNIETINQRVDKSSGGVFLTELQTKLAGVVQYLPSITNVSHFNNCVDTNFEVTRLLSQFGYSNDRIDNVIRSSLSSRKEAQSANEAVLAIVQQVEELNAKIEKQQERLEHFFVQCFDEENIESFENKADKITKAYEQICDETGYSEQIKTANTESLKLSAEILEYRDELFEGDSTTESVKTHINELIQDLSMQQKKMQDFIQDYITGISTVSEDDQGKEVTNTIKSKKNLVDELHASFEKHIENEKNKISVYQSAFTKYEDGKKAEIEELLKGATNASLAGSFEKLKDEIDILRKKSETSFQWSIFFIVAAILIPYIPYVNGIMFPTNSDIYLNLLKRIALTGPFLWWAFHQSRQANQYFRLEQEYAHKAVVSRSFEGYKSQVLELYKESEASNQMLHRLLSGSIDTITKNPAEVLDKIKHTSSPIETITNSVTNRIPKAV